MATDSIADCKLPIAELKFAISDLKLVPEDIADCQLPIADLKFAISDLKLVL